MTDFIFLGKKHCVFFWPKKLLNILIFNFFYTINCFIPYSIKISSKFHNTFFITLFFTLISNRFISTMKIGNILVTKQFHLYYSNVRIT